MDESDIASEAEQRYRDAAINKARQSAPIVGVFACLNCYEPFTERFLCHIPKRFCDADCRDDYEIRNRP